MDLCFLKRLNSTELDCSLMIIIENKQIFYRLQDVAIFLKIKNYSAVARKYIPEFLKQYNNFELYNEGIPWNTYFVNHTGCKKLILLSKCGIEKKLSLYRFLLYNKCYWRKILSGKECILQHTQRIL